MQKFVPAVMKKLYDNSVIEDQFFIKWHEKKLRLDRTSIMYDKRAQDTMRPLLTEFVGWLQSAEYDDEEAYGEEEKGAEAQDEEEEEKKEVEETEDQRNQRLLIEAQKQR